MRLCHLGVTTKLPLFIPFIIGAENLPRGAQLDTDVRYRHKLSATEDRHIPNWSTLWSNTLITLTC